MLYKYNVLRAARFCVLTFRAIFRIFNMILTFSLSFKLARALALDNHREYARSEDSARWKQMLYHVYKLQNGITGH